MHFSSADYPQLLSFIRADTNGAVTFVLTRYTAGSTAATGADLETYIHAVASKEHATAPAPELDVLINHWVNADSGGADVDEPVRAIAATMLPESTDTEMGRERTEHRLDFALCTSHKQV